jgi:hypothetical protein
MPSVDRGRRLDYARLERRDRLATSLRGRPNTSSFELLEIGSSSHRFLDGAGL